MEIEHRVGVLVDMTTHALREIARVGVGAPIAEVRGPADMRSAERGEPRDARIVGSNAVRQTHRDGMRERDSREARDVVEQGVGPHDLVDEVLARDRVRPRVRPRVIAERVAFARDAHRDVAQAFDVLAEEKERRLNARVREDIEKSGGRRTRPVVERQPSAQKPS